MDIACKTSAPDCALFRLAHESCRKDKETTVLNMIKSVIDVMSLYRFLIVVSFILAVIRFWSSDTFRWGYLPITWNSALDVRLNWTIVSHSWSEIMKCDRNAINSGTCLL